MIGFEDLRDHPAVCTGTLPHGTRTITPVQHARLAALLGMPATDRHGRLVVDRTRRLLAELAGMPEAPALPCGWAGPVDGLWEHADDGGGVLRWACPRCGTEHADRVPPAL